MDINKIFQNVELPAIITDAKGNCVKINPSFLRFTHYNKDIEKNSVIFDFLPPEDMQEILNAQSRETFKIFTTRLLNQRGEYIPVDCTLISGTKNMLFVFQDRRPAVKVEEKMEYAEEYAKRVIDTIDAGIVLLDKTLKIVRINPAGKNILGLLEDEVIGKDFIRKVPALKSLLNNIIDVIEDNTEIEKAVYNLGGRYYRIEIFPYRIGNKIEGAILYFEDKTERFNFEQEEKKARILYETLSISTQGFNINFIIKEIGKKILNRLSLKFIKIHLFHLEERRWEEVYSSRKGKDNELLVSGYLGNKEVVRIYYPSSIDKDFVPVLNSIANYIALAYDRISLYKQQTHYISFLNSLIQIYGELLSPRSEKELFQGLAERIFQLMNVDRVTIFIKKDDSLIPVVSVGEHSKEIMETRLSVGEGFTGWVASSGIPDYTNDAVNDPRSKHIPKTPHNVRESLLAVPLILNKEVIGVISMSRTAKGYFTDDNLKMMLSFANIIQSTLERNRLYTHIERKYKETNILFNISKMVMQNKREEIYSAIVENLKSLGVDIVDVVGFDEKGDLYIYASEGLGITKFPEKTQFKRENKIMKDLLDAMHSYGIYENHNLDNTPELKKHLYSKDIVSFYIIPVWDEMNNFLLGILLSWKTLHKMEEDEREFYRSLSNILTTSFTKEIVSERELSEEKEISELISLYNDIDISGSEQEIMDKITGGVNRIFNAEETIIFVHRRNYLHPISGAGALFEHKGFKIKDNEGLSGYAFQTGEIQYQQDTGDSERIKHFRGIPREGTVISSPLIVNGEKLGVITINLYEKEGYRGSHYTAIKLLKNIIEKIIESKRFNNIKVFMDAIGGIEEYKTPHNLSLQIISILKNNLWYNTPGIYLKDSENEIYISDINFQEIENSIKRIMKRKKEGWIKGFFFVPLQISEREAGVLFANNIIDIVSFREIASFAQIYLEEIISLNQIKNNASMLEDILMIGRSVLSRGFDKKAFVPYLSKFRKSGGFSYIAILLREDAKLVLKIYDKGKNVSSPKNKVLALDRTSLITTAFNRGKTIIVKNTKRSKLYLEGIKGIKSELCVPITYKDRIYGVIDVGKDITGGFSQDDVKFFETLGLFFGAIIGKEYPEKEDVKQQKMADVIFESIPSGVLLLNRKGEIERINKFALKMFSHHKKDLIKKGIEHLFGDEGKSLLLSVVKDGKKLHRREAFALTGKGEKIPVGFSASPVYEGNRLSGGLLIIRDLTKIKEMEERLRRVNTLAVLGEMAAGMAHEIRNPLAAVKAGMEFIKKKLEKNPSDVEYLNMILNEIVRVERIVNDMIVYARRPPIRPVILSIDAPLKKALSIMSDNIEGKNIEVNMKAVKGLPPIMGDEDQLEEVFTNILSNAIDALPEKNGKIDIMINKKGNKVIISIADNGMGIPSDILPKIFNPFFTTKQKGIGLGLSIVQRIVSEHKGTIRVESKCQEGTKFYIELPVYKEEGII